MLFSLLWFLLIGLAAGWLAGQVTRGRDFGAVNNMIVGVLGAVLGGLLFRIVGLGPTNILGDLISATVGAILVLTLMARYGRRL